MSANLKNLDKHPSSFSLNFSSTYSYRSLVGGLISLCYIIIGLAIFSTKTIDLFNKINISYNTRVVKDYDHGALDTSSGVFYIKIKNGSKFIQFDNLSSFGMEAVFIRFVLYKNNTSVEKLVPAVNCGASPYQICIPFDDKENFIRGNVEFLPDIAPEEEIYRRLELRIRRCNANLSEKCKYPPLNQSYVFYLYYTNNQINPENPNSEQLILPQKVLRVLQSHYSVNPSVTIIQTLYLKRVNISTDNSIFPSYFNFNPEIEERTSWFYDEEKLEQVFYNDKEFSNIMIRILLKRSTYTHVFTRSYEKFDSMLGKVFGELSLIALALFGIYQGYNSWSFQQILKKKLGLSYIQPNLYDYYLYIIKKILRTIFCCCTASIKKQLKQIDAETQKLNNKLDYFHLIEQVNKNTQLIQLILRERNISTPKNIENKQIENKQIEYKDLQQKLPDQQNINLVSIHQYKEQSNYQLEEELLGKQNSQKRFSINIQR